MLYICFALHLTRLIIGLCKSQFIMLYLSTGAGCVLTVFPIDSYCSSIIFDAKTVMAHITELTVCLICTHVHELYNSTLSPAINNNHVLSICVC